MLSLVNSLANDLAPLRRPRDEREGLGAFSGVLRHRDASHGRTAFSGAGRTLGGTTKTDDGQVFIHMLNWCYGVLIGRA